MAEKSGVLLFRPAAAFCCFGETMLTSFPVPTPAPRFAAAGFSSSSPKIYPAAAKVRAGRFADEFVTCSWFLEGSLLHYTTQIIIPRPIYPSLDPKGRDNSFWFLCFDHKDGTYLPGGFEEVLDSSAVPDGRIHAGVIETAGRDFDALSITAGVSFMIEVSQPTHQSVLF